MIPAKFLQNNRPEVKMIDRTFIIDSNDLSAVKSALYGYMVTDDGRLFIDEIPDEISDTGSFVLVTCEDGRITVRQDICGQFGLFLYKKDGRFALSNSFFKLAEHLRGEITINQKAAAVLSCAISVPISKNDTLANEIIRLDNHASVEIDAASRTIEIVLGEKVLAFKRITGKDDLDLLDKWYFKWVRVFRQLAADGRQITADLSGGVDSRLVIAMLLSGNVDLDSSVRVLSHEYVDMEKDREDYVIAKQIAETFGFTLNAKGLIRTARSGEVPASVPYDYAKYTSFGNSNLIIYGKEYLEEPQFNLKGLGSTLKGGHNVAPDNWMWMTIREETRLSDDRNAAKKIRRVMWLRRKLGLKWPQLSALEPYCRDVCDQLLEGAPADDDHKSAIFYYHWSVSRQDGLKIVNWMTQNKIVLTPFHDPVIMRFDYDPDRKDGLWFATLLYDRFCPKMLEFPLEGGRSFNRRTVEEVSAINAKYPVRVPEFDRIYGHPEKVMKQNCSESGLSEYIKEVIESPDFIERVAPYAGKRRTETIIKETDLSAMNKLPQRLNALLSIYELTKLI